MPPPRPARAPRGRQPIAAELAPRCGSSSTAALTIAIADRDLLVFLVADSLRPPPPRPGGDASAAAAIAEPPTAPGRAEVASELQLGIEVAGAGHRHRLHRSASSA